MSNRVLHHSFRTIRANNPIRPRHRKLFRVSYYLPSEVDSKGLAPLRMSEVQALHAVDARTRVITGGRRLVSAYKASGMYKLARKKRHRRIYTLSPTFAIPPELKPNGTYYTRMYPICRLPG